MVFGGGEQLLTTRPKMLRNALNITGPWINSLVCTVDATLHTKQSTTQNNKYQMSQKHSCFSWWWAHSRPKHVEIDKYTKNKLYTKLALFTRLSQRILAS